MDMLTVRDTVIRGLYGYVQHPIVLSDQTVPESDMPYAYYQVVQPYMPIGGAELDYSGDSCTRTEQVEMTISIVACSANRTVDGVTIYGDNEALSLADNMLSWIAHIGRDYLRERGIAVVACGNVTNRTAVEVDEVARRYGFDARLRYVRTAAYDLPHIDGGSIRS